jgi:hypothetical protein
MDSIPTSLNYSNMLDFRDRPTISSWEIMSIEENSPSKPSVLCSHTRLKTPRTSSCLEAITNAQVLIAFTASTINVFNHL